MDHEVLIIGAGVAGLTCARELRAAGLPAVVLDKSRGVGGRCATRRIEGQPVDHGTPFLHGSHPSFVDELRALARAETAVTGWPLRVHGAGPPCQPGALDEGTFRVAFDRGVTAFAKSLAQGIDVRLQQRVDALGLESGGVDIDVGTGEARRARTVVLALPPEQSLALLDPLRAIPEVTPACELLTMIGSAACLTLIAGYPPGTPEPDWCLCHPDDSPSIQLVSHDSSKRSERHWLVLVAQARPSWSRRWLDRPVEAWRDELLGELAGLLGPWAARPAWTDTQNWRYARIDGGAALSHPMVLRLPGGARLGLIGEPFGGSGGVEAAWSSGRQLARRLAEE